MAKQTKAQKAAAAAALAAGTSSAPVNTAPVAAPSPTPVPVPVVPVPPVPGAEVPPVPVVPPPPAAPVPPVPPVVAQPAPVVEIPPPVVPVAGPSPVPPVTPPATPAPVVVKPPKDEQNGWVRPGEGTKTRAVWDIADNLTATNGGKAATRKDVVAAAYAAGQNPSMATTQYGRWAQYRGFTGDKSPAKQNAPAAPVPTNPVPAPAPVATDPAYQAGYEGCKAAVGGASVSNPYLANSPESAQFLLGWDQSYADITAAQTPAQ